MQSNREVASGVTNLGNTCYINAVLQALAHTPELCMAVQSEPHCPSCPVYLKNHQSASATNTDMNANANTNTNTSMSIDTNSINDFCLLCEMEQHLIRVHESGEAVRPNSFVKGFISHVAPWFRLGVQEDSHEFLRLVIDAMQKSSIHSRIDAIESTDHSDAFQPPPQDATIDNTNTNTSTDANPKTDPDANIDNANANTNTAKTAKTDSDRKDKSGNEYSFRLFCGKVESIVKCSHCSFISSKIDPIEDIGLEVTSTAAAHSSSNFNSSNSHSHLRRDNASPTPSNSLTDVPTALQKFVATEYLDSGYKCESCGKVGRATKQSKLKAIPPILTLHLKRFRYGNDNLAMQSPVPSRRRTTELAGLGMGGGEIGSSGSAKIEGHVKFPQVFDIRPYLTEEMQDRVKSMLCRLFAVIVHSGKNSHSGHYVSYVRNVAKNEWWKMDDAKVTLVSKEEVFNAEAYMLFYRVVDHPVSVELKTNQEIFRKQAEEVQKAKATLVANEHSAAGKTTAAASPSDAAIGPTGATSATASASMSAVVTGSGVSNGSGNMNGSVNSNVNSNSNANGTTSISTPISTTNSTVTSGKKRQRDTPEFKSGEEWARKMTNKPKSMLHFIRAAQDYLCERIEFKPEYMNMMEEEVHSGNRVQNGPSFGISLEDDVTNFDMLDGFRHALWTLFKTILPMDQVELVELFKPKEKKGNGNGGGNGNNGNGGGNGNNGNGDGRNNAGNSGNTNGNVTATI